MLNVEPTRVPSVLSGVLSVTGVESVLATDVAVTVPVLVSTSVSVSG